MKHVRITVFLFLTLVMTTKALASINQIKVYKSLHRMDLINDGKVVKSYRVMLARGGSAPKEKRETILFRKGNTF